MRIFENIGEWALLSMQFIATLAILIKIIKLEAKIMPDTREQLDATINLVQTAITNDDSLIQTLKSVIDSLIALNQQVIQKATQGAPEIDFSSEDNQLQNLTTTANANGAAISDITTKANAAIAASQAAVS